MKRIQIIGQITGLDRKTVEDKFNLSESQLKEKGWEVVNPTKLVSPETSWSDSMRECLKSLLTVDAIAIQPDWYQSEGAKIEYMVASALQLKEVRV